MQEIRKIVQFFFTYLYGATIRQILISTVPYHRPDVYLFVQINQSATVIPEILVS